MLIRSQGEGLVFQWVTALLYPGGPCQCLSVSYENGNWYWPPNPLVSSKKDVGILDSVPRAQRDPKGSVKRVTGQVRPS